MFVAVFEFGDRARGHRREAQDTGGPDAGRQGRAPGRADSTGPPLVSGFGDEAPRSKNLARPRLGEVNSATDIPTTRLSMESDPTKFPMMTVDGTISY